MPLAAEPDEDVYHSEQWKRLSVRPSEVERERQTSRMLYIRLLRLLLLKWITVQTSEVGNQQSVVRIWQSRLRFITFLARML